MVRKMQIFDELMGGFRDAIARKMGQSMSLRVTEIPRVKPTRPSRREKRESSSRLH